ACETQPVSPWSSEDLERARFRRRFVLRGDDGLAIVVLLDAANPVAGAHVEPEIVVHRAAARDQDAEVGAFVAVVAGAGDAQEEGLTLAVDRAALVVETLVADAAVL